MKTAQELFRELKATENFTELDNQELFTYGFTACLSQLSEGGGYESFFVHPKRSPYHSQVFTHADMSLDNPNNTSEFLNECTEVINVRALQAANAKIQKLDEFNKSQKELNRLLANHNADLKSRNEELEKENAKLKNLSDDFANTILKTLPMLRGENK